MNAVTFNLRPILALDISTRTGWALGVAGSTARHGVWVLPPAGASIGERISALDNKLADAITVMQPRLVIFEAPISKQQTSARLLISLAGNVEKVCWELGVRCTEARPDEVRKALLGKARFSEKRDDGTRISLNKSAVIEWARSLGYAPADDNAADALALLHFAFTVEQARSRTDAEKPRW